MCQAGGEFVCRALNIAVEGGDYGGDAFAAHGFVVVVEMIPDGVASLGVAKLEFKGETRGHRGTGDLLEVVKVPVEQIVAANATALGVDGAVAAGRTQRTEQNVLDHFRGRLGPALVFVGAHVLVVGTIDDVIFAVEMRRHDGTHENGERIDVAGRWVGGVVGGKRELVVLRGARCSAARNNQGANQQN